MRRIAVIVAAVVVGALAPAAVAEQYEFVASNGTHCVLDKAHASTLQADGSWDIGWTSGVTCQGRMRYVAVGSEVLRFKDDGVPVFYHGTSAFCDEPKPTAKRPCGTWTVASTGGAQDVPGTEYTYRTNVALELPVAEGLEVQPVWVVTPAGSLCLPGGRTTGCQVTESFKPQ